MTCHQKTTAWLFHAGASQNYCVSHLSSRRNDGGLTIRMSCLKDKPNMRAGAKWEGHTWGRRSAPQYYKYLSAVSVKHTLSCTGPSKIAAKGVGVPHLGVAGRRAWPRTWEGPFTFYIIYTQQRDETTTARVGMNTCERTTVAARDLTGPNIQHAFMSEARQFWFVFLLKADTQLACQVHQERTQVVCSNKIGRSRPAPQWSSDTLLFCGGCIGMVLSVFRMWNVVLKWCICMLIFKVGIVIVWMILIIFELYCLVLCFERVFSCCNVCNMWNIFWSDVCAYW